ncbi:putative ankyrin repeat protein [Eutypa lata UCREL1]|uniref:Putative ankyrin repeat protein n=1 Tax=Eutypa lata (strain UCR-EL1) TaxID=1287681 RepID=M7TV70_EUTLA|nr:putative ankyrin repeat protein [Eutypa lata UCREL1]
MNDLLQKQGNSHEIVNTADEYGRTPLHLAARMGDVELGQVLLDHGADINAQDSDFHPHSVLDIALATNQYSFAKFLLDNGADESLVLKVYQSRLEEMKATIEEERRILTLDNIEYR